MVKKNKNFLLYLLFAMAAMVLVIISSYLAIAELSDFKNAKDTLKILISIIGLFTTFGGAYLGAYLSGKNALHNIKRQNYIDKVDNLKAIQNELLFNMNYLWDFLSNVYAPLGFSLKKVKIELGSIDRETKYFYLIIYNNLVKNDIPKIGIDQSFYLNLLLLKEVINANSREYRLFDEILPSNKNKYFNTDKFYKLKQNIDSIKNFITVEEHYAYIHLNKESKQYIISLLDFADQVHDILLKTPLTTDNI